MTREFKPTMSGYCLDISQVSYYLPLEEFEFNKAKLLCLLKIQINLLQEKISAMTKEYNADSVFEQMKQCKTKTGHYW